MFTPQKILYFNISMFKSILRLLGSFVGIVNSSLSIGLVGVTLERDLLYITVGVLVLCIFFFTAEILGILEEVFDKRKED